MSTNANFVVSAAAAAVAVLSAAATFLPRAAEAPPPGSDAVATVAQRLDAQARELAEATASLRALSERVQQLAAQRREAAPTTRSDPAQADTAATHAEASAPRAAAKEAALPEEHKRFRTAMGKMFRNGTGDSALSEAEQGEFWRLARTTGVIDTILAELKATVAQSPRDVAARMELADAYTAKLLTLPGGPEQGVWGGKAERQWQAVLAQDPDHWEARFALGFNYSMYPSFVDKSREAIEHLEAARRQLPSLPVEPRQVEAYTALARMYARQHKTEQARAALAEGLTRFPGDERILRAQALLGEARR